jgi:hypothetical protein
MNEIDRSNERLRLSALTLDEMNQEYRSYRLALRDWIWWFEFDERQSSWWDCYVKSEHAGVVVVEVAEWPTPWGTLDWLLRACGATQVETP